jgi:hypothetical protein
LASFCKTQSPRAGTRTENALLALEARPFFEALDRAGQKGFKYGWLQDREDPEVTRAVEEFTLWSHPTEPDGLCMILAGETLFIGREDGVHHRHWETMNHIRKLLGLEPTKPPVPREKNLLPYVAEKRWPLLAMTFHREEGGQFLPRPLYATFETPEPFVPILATPAGKASPALDVYVAGEGAAEIEGLEPSAWEVISSAALDLLGEESNMSGVLQKGMAVTCLTGIIKGDVRHVEVKYAGDAPAGSETQ